MLENVDKQINLKDFFTGPYTNPMWTVEYITDKDELEDGSPYYIHKVWSSGYEIQLLILHDLDGTSRCPICYPSYNSRMKVTINNLKSARKIDREIFSKSRNGQAHMQARFVHYFEVDQLWVASVDHVPGSQTYCPICESPTGNPFEILDRTANFGAPPLALPKRRRF
jgi:hypothetical protein